VHLFTPIQLSNACGLINISSLVVVVARAYDPLDQVDDLKITGPTRLALSGPRRATPIRLLGRLTDLGGGLRPWCSSATVRFVRPR